MLVRSKVDVVKCQGEYKAKHDIIARGKKNFRRVGAKSDFLGVINIAQISVSLMAQNEVFS